MKKKVSCLVLLVFVINLLLSGMAFADELIDATGNDKTIVKTGTDPLWSFVDITVPDKVLIGQEFEMEITVRNIGTGSGLFPELIFTEESEEKELSHFEVVNGGGVKDGFNPMIKEVKSGETKTFTVKMKVKNETKELPEGSSYLLNCSIVSADWSMGTTQTIDPVTGETTGGFTSSVDRAQKKFKATRSISLNPVYSLSEPVFVVKGVAFDPQITEGTTKTTATITLENISDSKANNVVATLEGNKIGETDKKNISVTDLTSTKQLYNIKGKQTVTVSYGLELNADRTNNEMTLSISFDGKEEPQKEIINMPLPLRSSTTGKNPKVIIERYNVEPSKVLAGNYVTLNLYVQNTNTMPVNNVSIKLEVPTENTSSGTTVSSGTVFSPVDSSNTFYIDRIEGKTSALKTITMYVNPNATAKTYVVPVEINFETTDGTEGKFSDNINIPVTQESRIDVIKSSFPTFGNAGEPLNFTAEFVNVGKTVLTNFKVEIVGENIPGAEESTYYVGTFEAGSTDEFNASIFPAEEGVLSGNVVFSYIDGDNQESSLEMPFTAEIGPAIPYEPMDPGMMEEPQESFIKKLGKHAVTIVLAVVIIAQAVILIRIKRKAKADEELMQ